MALTSSSSPRTSSTTAQATPFSPPYAIREFGGGSIAFVGLTLEGTANIVARSSVDGLTFVNEAETVNSLIPELRSKGIEAVVVLLHEGGFSDGGPNDCGSGLDGAVAEVAAQLDDAVDLVIAGHTHDEFVCEIDGMWVTMADNAGRLFTVIEVTLDGTTKDLTVQNIRNLPNSQEGVTPAPEPHGAYRKVRGTVGAPGKRRNRQNCLRHSPAGK